MLHDRAITKWAILDLSFACVSNSLLTFILNGYLHKDSFGNRGTIIIIIIIIIIIAFMMRKFPIKCSNAHDKIINGIKLKS